MGIFDLIQKKKAEFQAQRETVATLKHDQKQEALIHLRERRKKLEAREATAGAVEKEKSKIQSLRREGFQRQIGPAGKVMKNIKKKIREGKKQGTPFTGVNTPPSFLKGSTGNTNIFTSSGPNPFDFTKKEPEKKKYTIIKIMK